MTKAELLVAFSTRLSELKRTVYYPRHRAPAKPKQDESFHHKFYPIQALSELIRQLSTLEGMDSAEKYTARYLVTDEGKLLLAREGGSDKFIPKHREIRPRCLAAGNINFSEDFMITGITHRSGDFQPDSASMAWPLAILFLLRQVVSPSFTLEEKGLNTMGSFELIASHDFRLAEIEAIVPAELMAGLIAANSNPRIEVHEYEDPKAKSSVSRRNGFFKGTIGLDLFGASDDTPKSSPIGPLF